VQECQIFDLTTTMTETGHLDITIYYVFKYDYDTSSHSVFYTTSPVLRPLDFQTLLSSSLALLVWSTNVWRNSLHWFQRHQIKPTKVSQLTDAQMTTHTDTTTDGQDRSIVPLATLVVGGGITAMQLLHTVYRRSFQL